MLVAARYRLGTLISQEVPDFAKRCMGVGPYSSDLDEIAASSYPVMSEVGPALERILSDQGVALPSREAAIRVLLREDVGAIAEGRIAPREGMARVERLYHQADLGTQTKEYVGDSHDLHRLLGNYYAYDDVSRASDAVVLDRAIVQEAQAWMETHGGGGELDDER
ncbi:MAG: hypothetical protein R3F05_01825 [Planctomycetota bacterium]